METIVSQDLSKGLSVAEAVLEWKKNTERGFPGVRHE